jgi:hypothetical protein
MDFWKDFKQVTISASIDGHEGLNEYIRGGSGRYDIAGNVRKMAALPNTTVIGKPTMQALNIFYLPEILDWMQLQPFDGIDYHFVTFPQFLDCRIWTGDARKEIEDKLVAYKNNQPAGVVYNVVDNVLKFFQSKETYTPELWDKFIEYNATLDTARDEDSNEFNFFKRYMKEHT